MNMKQNTPKETTFELSLKDDKVTIIEKKERKIFLTEHDGSKFIVIENDENYRTVEKVNDCYYHVFYDHENRDWNKEIKRIKISEEEAIRLISERIEWLIEMGG